MDQNISMSLTIQAMQLTWWNQPKQQP